MGRTSAEVGDIVRRRRQGLGIPQEGVPGVSDSLVRQIEQGEAPDRGRGGKRQAFMAALGWPPDALARLRAGEDPNALTAAAGGTGAASSDLRELLGAPGQLIDERLSRLEGQMAEIYDLLAQLRAPEGRPG